MSVLKTERGNTKEQSQEGNEGEGDDHCQAKV